MAAPHDIATLSAEFDAALSGARNAADLKAVRDRFLSRKHGLVTLILKSLGSLAPSTP